MGILISVLTVLFAILCVLLIIIILLQSNKSAGMGILGGSSQSAFGSTTANVITKATSVMVALFMIGSLGLAVLESTKSSLEKNVLSNVEDTTELEAEKQTGDKSGVSSSADENK